MPIYLFFDACHMLKLVRNMLAQYGTVVIPHMGRVEWAYVVKLHQLQEAEGLRAANRLTGTHIFFSNQKMKVKYAAQTLSASVASALNFVRRLDIEGFRGSATTEYFIECIDHVFDVFNSRSPHGKGYKAPLTESSVQRMISFLHKVRYLLLSLENEQGVKVCKTRRSLSVIGFAFNINSLLELAPFLLKLPGIKYVLTYKFSQDHLELFFSCVRRAGGWNNNPSAKQYCAIHRRLLSHAGLCASAASNVLPLDETDMLIVPAESSASVFTEPDVVASPDAVFQSNLSEFVEYTLEYIAGWVVRKLQPQVKCSECVSALICQCPDDQLSVFSLLTVKNNGGLVVPSSGVIKVVKCTEQILRSTVDIHRVRNSNLWGLALETQVLESLAHPLFDEECADHFDATLHGIDSHYFSVIRGIVRCFLSLRKFHCINLTNQHLKGLSIRNKLNKTVLFKNQ
jgi:hypothetical protein